MSLVVVFASIQKLYSPFFCLQKCGQLRMENREEIHVNIESRIQPEVDPLMSNDKQVSCSVFTGKMFKLQTYKGLFYFFKFTRRGGVLPFTFLWKKDIDLKQLKAPTNPIRYIFLCLLISWSLFYAIFVFHCFLHGFVTGNRSVALLGMDALISACFFLLVWLQSCILWKRHEFVYLYNQVVELDGEFTGKYGINNDNQ